MIDIDAEFDRFFEFPTVDRSTVSSVSCKLFAKHVAEIARVDAGIKVKCLEWTITDDALFYAYAQTDIGTYEISQPTRINGFYGVHFEGPLIKCGARQSLEEAKLAAQSDHDKRVLSRLVCGEIA